MLAGFPPFVRFMIFNWLLGMAAGLVCAGIALALDIGGLRSLLWASDMLVTGLVLLFGGFAFTLGGVVCATAVMTLKPAEEEGERDI